MRRNKILMLLTTLALAVPSVGCSLSIEQILEMQEGSQFELTVLTLPPAVLELEGGMVMDIDISIGLFDLILGNVDGDIGIGELLFAAPPFDFLGLPAYNTGNICVVPQEGDPGGGTFDGNIYASQATFDVTLNTIALIGNPVLAANLPGGGFPFAFHIVSQQALGLSEMLGLLTGSGGGLNITQTLDEDVTIPLDPDGPGGADPVELPGHIGGQVIIASADAFPTTPLLDECIDFLNP